jgi:hypothetical protein
MSDILQHGQIEITPPDAILSDLDPSKGKQLLNLKRGRPLRSPHA